MILAYRIIRKRPITIPEPQGAVTWTDGKYTYCDYLTDAPAVQSNEVISCSSIDLTNGVYTVTYLWNPVITMYHTFFGWKHLIYNLLLPDGTDFLLPNGEVLLMGY